MFHQFRKPGVRISVGAVGTAVALLLALVVATPAGQAQTLTVLHSFSGGGDGDGPSAGVTMDRAGNIYGTALYGGGSGNGTVFKLSHSGSN